MKRLICMAVVMVFVSMTLWGCGGPAPPVKEKDNSLNLPEWYLTPPEDPDNLWATGECRSSDIGMAKEKAATTARTGIAKQQDLRLNNLTKRFQEEIMGADDASQILDQFSSATKEVVATTLRGAKQVEIDVRQDGPMKQVYILYKYPVGAGAEALLNNLKKKDELYTRFRASQAFEEMEKEVQKFEEYKQDN